MTSVKEVVSIETKNTSNLETINFTESHVQQLLDESKIFATTWAVKTFIQILKPDIKELNYNLSSSEKCILERLHYSWNKGPLKFERLLERLPISSIDFKNLSFSQVLDIIIVKCFTFDVIGKSHSCPVSDIDILDRFNGTINSSFLHGYYTSIKSDYSKKYLVHVCNDVNILNYVKSSWRNKDYIISENVFHRISCLVENFINYFEMGITLNIYDIQYDASVYFLNDGKVSGKITGENIKVTTVDAIFKHLDLELKDCSSKEIPMFLVLKAIHKNKFCKGINRYSRYCDQYCYKYPTNQILGAYCDYVCIGTINTDDFFNEERCRIGTVYYHTTKIISSPYDPEDTSSNNSDHWDINYPTGLILFAEWWNKKKCAYKLPKYLSGKFCLKLGV